MTYDTKKRQIWVTFQRKGYHRYPEAGTNAELADVSYLAHPHRHLFKFKIWIDVMHDNREIEFHQFLNWIESQINDTISMDYKSCEMLSDDIAFLIKQTYPGRSFTIEVSEDGECGVTCTY